MKTNILYIGNYYDNNGLGQSCRRFINFFGKNRNYNLTTKPLFVTYNMIAPIVYTDNYIEYENNTYKKYDILIQHTLPEYMEYNKNFGKNIAIVEIETLNIKHSGWVDKLNMMDEIWVGSVFALESLKNSGVLRTIKIIPEPYNIDLYNQEYNTFFDYDANNPPFIFYTIGQYAEKKNIKSIIFAYLLEFNKADNVKLFIKTCDYRRKNEDLENLIKFDMVNLRNIIRKSDETYSDVDILCGYMSDTDIIRLHKSSSCYINAARADSFGASAIEASLCNNIVINTKNIGSSTYFNNTNAIMIDSSEIPVLCSNSQLKNINTIHENWYEPSIDMLRSSMRKATMLSTKEKNNLNINFDKSIFNYETIDSLII